MTQQNFPKPPKATGCQNSADTNTDRFQVWDASCQLDRDAWLRHWKASPDREVFAHPAYLQLFQTSTDRVLCAAFSSPAGKVMYPFLLRDLSTQIFWKPSDGVATDLTAPFGYGGPIGWEIEDRTVLTDRFWGEFAEWASIVGIVSEFSRLSLFTDSLVDSQGDRYFRQQNVVRSLHLSEEELWHDFRHKVRKNVNNAKRNDIHVEIDLRGERVEDFLNIYSSTMDRRAADESFRFDRNFFERVQAELDGQYVFFHACQGSRVISTELVLVSATRIYSWLGGTDAEYFNLRPNDLLKFEIMRWAQGMGKHSFILGGGASPNDGIFQYKLSFAPQGVMDYFCRRRIVDPKRYQTFVDRTARPCDNQLHTSTRDFFPAYRAA